MNPTSKCAEIFLLVLAGQLVHGQTPNQEKALSLGREAIQLMDNGKVDESIKLLEESQKLDPARFDYPYELAYAHHLKKDLSKTVEILESIRGHKDVTERYFQLLGNTYDMLGKTAKAFAAYDAGLIRFPHSGMMYLEKGNVHRGKKEFDKALGYYEQGIQVDPLFPSNYFRASQLYLGSSEKMWGLIYGEIFMNLERNTSRTAEMSKLLFDTYRREIKFSTDSSLSVSFCQQMVLDPRMVSDPKNIQLPYCMIYEPTMLLSVASEKSIDIGSLDRIRTSFVTHYFGNKRHETYPNALFSYQKTIQDAGHLEAYNHWILMKGDEDGFDRWLASSQAKWQAFVNWFGDNGLKLSPAYKFHSSQYTLIPKPQKPN